MIHAVWFAFLLAALASARSTGPVHPVDQRSLLGSMKLFWIIRLLFLQNPGSASLTGSFSIKKSFWNELCGQSRVPPTIGVVRVSDLKVQLANLRLMEVELPP